MATNRAILSLTLCCVVLLCSAVVAPASRVESRKLQECVDPKGLCPVIPTTASTTRDVANVQQCVDQSIYCNGSCCQVGPKCCGGRCCLGGEEFGVSCCTPFKLNPAIFGECCRNQEGRCCGGKCCAHANKCCGTTKFNAQCCKGECCGANCCPEGTGCCDGKACCARGQRCCKGKCCDQGAECCGGQCCPVGTACCGGKCCKPGFSCCNGQCCEIKLQPQCCTQVLTTGSALLNALLPAAAKPGKPGPSEIIGALGTCCPGVTADGTSTGLRCCGTACCKGGSVCCQDPRGNPLNRCCPEGATCCDDGKTCCEKGTKCCGNGKCCKEGTMCCGKECCPAGTQCCGDGKCCPMMQTSTGMQSTCCGRTCCDPKLRAQCCVGYDRKPGECCAGLDANGGETGNQCCGKRCCGKGFQCCKDANGIPLDQCCPEGTQCCGSTCCKPGYECCGDGQCCPIQKAACWNNTCCDVTLKPLRCAIKGTDDQGQTVELQGACCPAATSTGAATGNQCCGRKCCLKSDTCCTDREGTPTETCCPEGSQCCQDGKTCCKKGTVCCGDGKCCPAETFCCKPTIDVAGNAKEFAIAMLGRSVGMLARKPKQDVAGVQCCKVGDSCCAEGTCCPKGTQCCGGGKCCPLDGDCCGATCCKPGFQCCGPNKCCERKLKPQCCGNSSLTTTGTPPAIDCCPMLNVDGKETGNECCGSACCMGGTRCCGGRTCCDLASKSLCCSIQGTTLGGTCCPQVNPTTGVPTGLTCCGAQCCKAGQECCGNKCCPPDTKCCGDQCCPKERNHCCGSTCCNPLTKPKCCGAASADGTVGAMECCPSVDLLGRELGTICCGKQCCMPPGNGVPAQCCKSDAGEEICCDATTGQ
ncbi:unnamed protein product [Closterium sp. NIES-64]|nr:unnamed protein product [Closterium sp. NIES-64]CAI6000152.1 unnamed protein product [Closterium sp. NIES-65]